MKHIPSLIILLVLASAGKTDYKETVKLKNLFIAVWGLLFLTLSLHAKVYSVHDYGALNDWCDDC